MKKLVIASVILAVGSVGYLIGKFQSHDSHEHNASSSFGTQPEQHSSSLKNTTTILTAPEVINELTKAKQKTTPQEKGNFTPSEAGSQAEKSIDELSVEYPHYFNDVYSEVAQTDIKYPRAIRRFTNENGISEWGITTEQEVQELMQSERLKNIYVGEFECRIRICLMRGKAESYDEAYRIYRDYQHVQQWGYHFGGQADETGQFHFYLATYKQGD